MLQQCLSTQSVLDVMYTPSNYPWWTYLESR